MRKLTLSIAVSALLFLSGPSAEAQNQPCCGMYWYEVEVRCSDPATGCESWNITTLCDFGGCDDCMYGWGLCCSSSYPVFQPYTCLAFRSDPESALSSPGPAHLELTRQPSPDSVNEVYLPQCQGGYTLAFAQAWRSEH